MPSSSGEVASRTEVAVPCSVVFHGSLAGAEAVLKLVEVTANGHLDEYWTYHLARQHERVHQTHYQEGGIHPQRLIAPVTEDELHPVEIRGLSRNGDITRAGR